MAQLNPNFEIDFSDINSYEQIQLINDTQLAKENLLMHRAYREPADDAVIRNLFSSFTFVDFCPKLFATGGSSSSAARQRARSESPLNQLNHQHSQKLYELETFSDLFDRINNWLRLNKDWRVVSMETLIFDSKSHFNHLKSSIHQAQVPRNTRALRLYLAPSKSRFAGAQKIGCINVVPRKVSGDQRPADYETLDQILARLNELLLTRPIGGRILSVETLTLPMVNGYVDTETNYYSDARLNLLDEKIHTISPCCCHAPDEEAGRGQCSFSSSSAAASTHTLIDILRVYYEFGPMVCGLVNLIDFLPCFYSSSPLQQSSQQQQTAEQAAESQQQDGAEMPASNLSLQKKIAATESLTRLTRRSLDWFEAERKRISAASSSPADPTTTTTSGNKWSARQPQPIGLKLCNLQVCQRTMLKQQLVGVNETPERTAIDVLRTREMRHQDKWRTCLPLECDECALTLTNDNRHRPASWCAHLLDLCQPHEVKFIRLAYVVPIFHRYSTPRYVAPALARFSARSPSGSLSSSSSSGSRASPLTPASGPPASRSSPSNSVAELPDPKQNCDQEEEPDGAFCWTDQQDENEVEEDEEEEEEEELAVGISGAELQSSVSSSSSSGSSSIGRAAQVNEFARRTALEVLEETSSKQLADERNHHLQLASKRGAGERRLDSPIGRLTYRLFAPCQLVHSSSCFAINPVNSSNPLARRGSVGLEGNGAGQSGSSLQLNGASSTSQLAVGLRTGDGQLRKSSLFGSAASSSSRDQLCFSARLASSPSSAAGHSSTSAGHSFGAYFPSIAHNLSLLGAANQNLHLHHHHHAASASAQTSANPSNPVSRFTTNEFEPVEAIRRRMEIYVTTNSMKVVAGETVVVNLSDGLACLSTAIEQTVVRRPASLCEQPTGVNSSWISVYILYAAVECTPTDLLVGAAAATQRLAPVSESDEPEEQRQQAGGADEIEPVFDDDFGAAQEQPKDCQLTSSNTEDQKQQQQPEEPDDEQQDESAHAFYNSAYDRTVALPTPPDAQLAQFRLEPVNERFLAGLLAAAQQEARQHHERRCCCLWSAAEQPAAAAAPEELTVGANNRQQQQQQRRRRRRATTRANEQQCAII